MFWIASYIVGLLIMLAVMPWIAKLSKRNPMPAPVGIFIAVLWPIMVPLMILFGLSILYIKLWDRIVKGA